MKITNILAREILDSRGNPTVEVDLYLNDIMGRASVPSGASTGSKEALELRDKDYRYHGKGVLKAVDNVNTTIKNALLNKEFNQETLDKTLIELDGTDNKSNLGANAILAVSLAFLKATAKLNNKELYEYVGIDYSLPIAMMNIINGGAHADNNLDFQEFMIVVLNGDMKERVRIGSEVFHTLKSVLKEKGLVTSVGDEGGFAPNLKNNREALDLICESIIKAGYKLKEDVALALDVAASEFYEDGIYKCDGKEMTSLDMIKFYKELVNEYPIISIEDGLDEKDYEGFQILTRALGNKIMLVGDDLFVTNKKIFESCIEKNICNAILLKANQIGTYSEMLETIKLAKKWNYKTIISHRSGETEDTFIADLAVGLNLGYIKTGSLSRTDRVSKYNQLMRIEEELKK